MVTPPLRCAVTRVIAFHALHRYHRADWSAEKNRQRFGWTADPPGHGHLYRVEVTVSGAWDPDTQMVIDLGVLDEILTDRIAGPLAGRHLNEAIPEFAAGAELPSCEAVAAWCWRSIAPRLPQHVTLDRVRVAEDPTLWADCTGPA